MRTCTPKRCDWIHLNNWIYKCILISYCHTKLITLCFVNSVKSFTRILSVLGLLFFWHFKMKMGIVVRPCRDSFTDWSKGEHFSFLIEDACSFTNAFPIYFNASKSIVYLNIVCMYAVTTRFVYISVMI